MMNSNSTPKIVVGIGLAAVVGVAVAMFVVRAKHESEIARSTPPAAVAASSELNAADAAAPAASVPAQTPADQAATAPSAATAAPAAAVTAPSAPGTAIAANDQNLSDHNRSDRHVAKARSRADSATTRIAAANSNTRSADMTSSQQAAVVSPSGDATSNESTSSAPAAAAAATQSAPAQTGQQAAGASDSQITADVKTEIATAAPDSNVIVTTTNGVVALAGSAPNQDAADQAKQAAQRVAGIGHVESSGLTVSNQ